MEALSGIILAGGQSKRFGSDKASALLAGRTLLQWVVEALQASCVEIIVSITAGRVPPPVESQRPLRYVEDERAGLGPLSGLVAGLAAATTPLAFAASCDVPLLRPELVTLLGARVLGHDIACGEADGREQPLGAIFRVEPCLATFRRALGRDQLKLTDAFDGLDVLRVTEEDCRSVDHELVSFMNVNRPRDLEQAEALLAARPWATGR